MSYLLDTSTLLEFLRAAPSKALIRRLSQVNPMERATSVISVSQLLVSARRENNSRLMQDVIRLIAAIRVVPYDLSAARSFAKLSATLPPETETDDLMVGAIALSRDLTLVTRRREHFSIYPHMRLEDWVQ
ncbi:MAG: PIN domain-containing protein [Myxococcota bacterium]